MPKDDLVLLTGASGVIGSELLPRLGRHNTISLTHRAVIDGQQIRGDLTQPRFGLDEQSYRDLADRVDTIVHAAAITDFATDQTAVDDLNITGTQRILDLAAESEARVLYVSTAFVARAELTRSARGKDDRESGATPDSYLNSKRRAEQLVRTSGLPAAIARPSVVVGHSVTGEIAAPQGLHSLLKAFLKNLLPLAPLDPDARIDLIPSDTVAAALAALVDAGVPNGEYWLTGGAAAPTVGALVQAIVEVGAELGIATVPPRFVSQDMVDRLLRPVFIDPLPEQARRKFDETLALASLFCGAETFPCSLDSIAGGPVPLGSDDIIAATKAAARHIARRSGIGPAAGRAA